MANQYRTLSAPHRLEIEKIKGSRFIASALPLENPDEVAGAREDLAREFPKANHHVYAWRLGQCESRFKSSDDGEPGGSAGRPVLKQIDNRELTDTAVIVTRIFGGTKLGVGGLVRAYGLAAARVLDSGLIKVVSITGRAVIEYPYELSNPVEGWVAKYSLVSTHREFTDRVRLTFELPPDSGPEILAELRERSGDRVRIQWHPPGGQDHQ